MGGLIDGSADGGGADVSPSAAAVLAAAPAAAAAASAAEGAFLDSPAEAAAIHPFHSATATAAFARRLAPPGVDGADPPPFRRLNSSRRNASGTSVIVWAGFRRVGMTCVYCGQRSQRGSLREDR